VSVGTVGAGASVSVGVTGIAVGGIVVGVSEGGNCVRVGVSVTVGVTVGDGVGKLIVTWTRCSA